MCPRADAEPPDADPPGAFSPRENALLEEAHRRRAPLRCPVCASPLDISPVRPDEAVSYVRRRLVVVCPGCGRHGAIDVARPGS